MDIYFINDVNYFGEFKFEVDGTILDSGELEVDLNEHILNYMKERGQFPSRTWFYLKTRPIDASTSTSIDLIQSQSDESDELPSMATKRKICATCFRTYITECILCSQDYNYKVSLAEDQLKGADVVTSQNSGTLEENNTSEENNEPNLVALRQRRVSALSNVAKSIAVDKKKSLDELIGELKLKIKCTEHVTFQVRRRHVFSDVLQKIKIFFGGQSLSRVTVEFISFMKSESGVDTGGLCRELFSLLYEEAAGKLLQGPTRKYTFVHDLERLEAGDFFAYGQSVVALYTS